MVVGGGMAGEEWWHPWRRVSYSHEGGGEKDGDNEMKVVTADFAI